MDSLRINVQYYGFLAALLLVLSVYLMLNTSNNTLKGVVGFMMALGNAWGLTLAMAFLGHGLIQLPRALWKSADRKRSLARIEFMAPRFKEQLIDAQADLDAVITEIQALHRKPAADPYLNEYIDELLNNTPLPNGDAVYGLSLENLQPASPTPVTKEYLVKLNYRAKEAIAHRGSSECKWTTLVQKALHLQDCINNEANDTPMLWSSSTVPPTRSSWIRFLQWFWYVKLDPIARRGAGLIAGGLSIMILWAEASLVYSHADWSPINWLIHWNYLSPTGVEVFTLILLLYLATCTYSSLMKVRIYRYYLMVPHHTDEKSLLFFGAYFCRLAFPLGYNYLTLIQGSGGQKFLSTEFSKVMGPMDLIPLLGKNFNYYFSIGLVAICLMVLLRWHGWLSQMFSSDPNFSFADYSDQNEEGSEGRELINAARRQMERSRNRSNDFSFSLGRASSSIV